MAKAEEGYDPRKSKVSDSTMETFRTGAITGDLNEVPGIGAAAIKKRAEGEGDPLLDLRGNLPDLSLGLGDPTLNLSIDRLEAVLTNARNEMARQEEDLPWSMAWLKYRDQY